MKKSWSQIRIGDKRKDIYIDTFLIRSDKIVSTLDIERLQVTHLHDRLLGRRVGLGCLEEQAVGQFLGSHPLKAPQVVKRHDDVDVVVPRNEATMPHGAQQRAAVEPVLYAIALADAVYHLEYLQLLELACAQVLLCELSKQFFIVHFQSFFPHSFPVTPPECRLACSPFR